MKLGIDFGTTNTAIASLKGDLPEALSFGDAAQEKYVPSVMAYREKGLRAGEYIGAQAKEFIGHTDIKVFQNFKMLLGESQSVVEQHWPNSNKKPDEITQKYISALLKKVDTEHSIRPDRIVVTVPEVWLTQNLHTKREHLINAFKSQGIKQVKVESEPVAAATYFLHRFVNDKKQPFNGHLLVCDCGGGTMDFCLAKIDQKTVRTKPTIKVLERTGNGQLNNSIGSAGVAFDQGVVSKLKPGLKEQNPLEFYSMVREFERKKINHAEDVNEYLDTYASNPSVVEGEAIFSIQNNNIHVCSEDLVGVFDDLIALGIQEAIKDLLERFASHQVDISNADNFRVLMVGGFSNFYLVQEEIRKAFGGVTESDKRFEKILSLQDISFAIAKGAALIANDMAEIIHTVPFDIGLKLLIGFGAEGGSETVNEIIVKKGEEISKYTKACWYKKNNRIKSVTILDTGQIPLFISPKKGLIVPISVEGKTLASIKPDSNVSDNEHNIGFSIDEDMTVSIHVRLSSKKKTKITSLGNLIGQLESGIIA